MEGGILTSQFSELVNPHNLLHINRFDIVVKWRYFCSLINGDDPEAQDMYIWHLARRRESNAGRGFGMESAKQSPQDYITGCHNLLQSMIDRSYDVSQPIPIDPFGRLLGGAHRFSCALALDIDVAVQRCQSHAVAPPWGWRWFWAQGLDAEGRKRLMKDWETLCQSSTQARATIGDQKALSKREPKQHKSQKPPIPTDTEKTTESVVAAQ